MELLEHFSDNTSMQPNVGSSVTSGDINSDVSKPSDISRKPSSSNPFGVLGPSRSEDALNRSGGGVVGGGGGGVGRRRRVSSDLSAKVWAAYRKSHPSSVAEDAAAVPAPSAALHDEGIDARSPPVRGVGGTDDTDDHWKSEIRPPPRLHELGERGGGREEGLGNPGGDGIGRTVGGSTAEKVNDGPERGDFGRGHKNESSEPSSTKTAGAKTVSGATSEYGIVADTSKAAMQSRRVVDLKSGVEVQNTSFLSPDFPCSASELRRVRTQKVRPSVKFAFILKYINSKKHWTCE
jgi:hypothetical protein